jgi:hypothetical protein
MNDINCNEKLLNIFYLVIREEFKDTKVVIRSRKLKDRQHYDQTTKGQKDKQRSTKHCTENLRSRITNLTKTRVTQVLRKNKQFLLH